MRTLFYLPLSREMTLVLCYLYPHGGHEFPGLFQGLPRCPKAPMRTGQEGNTLEVSAFLSPLVSSMEPQEIASELSDEEHLNVGRSDGSSGSRRVCASLHASRGSAVSTTPRQRSRMPGNPRAPEGGGSEAGKASRNA